MGALLSRKETIHRHRELWNKITDMTEVAGEPIDWGRDSFNKSVKCIYDSSPFYKWPMIDRYALMKHNCMEGDIKDILNEIIQTAREIANLPER